MKVLIVDDDRLVAASLKTIVESDPDIEVLATGNSGDEAIELYRTYNPDVLLMDIRMGKPVGERSPTSASGGSQPGELKHLSTRRKRHHMRFPQ